MELQTKDYGSIEYEEEDLFFFPDGLFGFPEIKHFLPLCLNEQEDSTMLLLHGVENPSIAFVVLDPFSIEPNYAPRLMPEELGYLGAGSEAELSYYVTCALKNDYLDNTVNLKCPLVMNPANRRCMQVIMEDSPYDYRKSLREFASIGEE